MYKKPDVVTLPRAVDAIQLQCSLTKILPLYFDICENVGYPVNQAVTASAYEADE